MTDNTDYYLKAAETAHNDAMATLQNRVESLEAELAGAHEIGKRLARDKHSLIRQNTHLVERVLQLEGTPVQLTQEEQDRIEQFVATVRSFCGREPASAGGQA